MANKKQGSGTGQRKLGKQAKVAGKVAAKGPATRAAKAPAKQASKAAAAEPRAPLPAAARKKNAVGSPRPLGGAAASAPVGQPKPKAKVAPPTLAELSTEELWVRYRKESDAGAERSATRIEDLRNQLMERHYPLVKYIAERLLQTLPKSIELDDLISAGLFGLMDAIRGFDQDRGIKFKTYCSTRIRGSILDQLRSQDWVPRLVRLKAGRIEKALQRLTGEYGREPTHAELAKALEMEHADLAREMEEAHAKTMFSLSEKWEDGEDDGSLEKVEILEDRQAIDPVHELNRRDLMGYIIKSLSDKEKFIIQMYYERGLTMREIGELLALTESRVCQIHSNVMSRLKDQLGQREGALLS